MKTLKTERETPELLLALREVFSYDPDTGVFTNKVDRSYHSKRGDIATNVHKDRGYHSLWFKGTSYKAHRVAWAFYHNKWPKGVIDHRDGVVWSNQISNLNSTTQAINNKNAKLRKDATSGCTGVTWVKATSQWCSRIAVEGRRVHLGLYVDFFEACCARKSAEVKYGFSERHGR